MAPWPREAAAPIHASPLALPLDATQRCLAMHPNVFSLRATRGGLLFLLLSLTAACESKKAGAGAEANQPNKEARVIHSLTVKRLDGAAVPLSSFSGKVLLVVNTASECGYTPQYDGLEALHAKYEARGFSVLGFPSNDFGGQEPGSSEEIATFCRSKYGITFPMFEKIAVKGSDRAPLYALLEEAQGAPKWNFHKYLIDKQGRPVEAWPSSVKPSDPEIAQAIERQLGLP